MHLQMVNAGDGIGQVLEMLANELCRHFNGVSVDYRGTNSATTGCFV